MSTQQSHNRYAGLGAGATPSETQRTESTAIGNDGQAETTPAPTPSATPTPIPTNKPSASKKVPKGSIFKTPKDEALTKAWIPVSEDESGSDQKGEVLIMSIKSIYDQTKPSYCQKNRLSLCRKE